MYRIDVSSAVASQPSPATLGTEGYFTDGNPGIGLPATVVSADWANQLQEELISVIDSASITHSKTNNAQVLAAIKQLINSGPAALVGSTRNLLAFPGSPTVLDVSADEIIVESALGGIAGKISGFSGSLNIATTGANGMDTSTASASAPLYIYAIKGSGQPDAVLGTLAGSGSSVYSGSHMPSGYTQSALISAVIMNGSTQFNGFVQQQREIYYTSGSGFLSGATGVTSFTSVSLTGIVPPCAKNISGLMQQTLTSASGSLTVQPVLASDASGTAQQDGGQTSTSSTSGIYNILNFRKLPIFTPLTVYWKSGDTRSSSISATIQSYEI